MSEQRPSDPPAPPMLVSGGQHTARAGERLRAVRRRIATAMLPPTVPELLGEIRLLPHQRTATGQLLRIMRQHQGALLADAVGLGKTFTALAVAQHYRHAAILAPAGLLAMWQAALLRTGQTHIAVHSLHRASLQAPPPFAELGHAECTRTLVIIDEAHALRNAGTARYRHVAGAVVGCDVLLLSATPLHNALRDLQALFALFRGSHADAADREALATLIVRRDHAPVTAPGRHRHAAPPPLRVHRPRTVPQDARTLDRLLALPAPFPARDGAVAGALIRLGLLRAWCSSDAALTHALSRRLQRGAAMRDALQAGRHPTPSELRSWVMSEELGADTQLGFPELLVEHTIENTQDTRPMLDLLTRHCEALQELRAQHTAGARADQVRAAYLRNIRERHPGVPIVAFSQHARTIQSLFKALSDIAGVGMLTSRQARIATGPIARTELLGYFAPRAQGRPPPPPTLQLSLLLTTDLIAEGVNLQDAGVVVHLDLPWTHALRAQRTGRVVRIGSPHALVHEYRFRASPQARRVMRAESLVARKAWLSGRYVGGGGGQRSPADRQNAWQERLASWSTDGGPCAVEASAVRTAVSPAREPMQAALVLVRSAAGLRVLAVVRRSNGRIWVSARTDALLALSDGRYPARCRELDGHPEIGAVSIPVAAGRPLSRSQLRRCVQRWDVRVRLRSSSGVSTALASATHDGTAGKALNVTQQRALRWLRHCVASCSALERQRLGVQLADARRCITTARGAGCDDALLRWIREPLPAHEAVCAWRRYPALVRAEAAATDSGDRSAPTASVPATAAAARMEACLFVRGTTRQGEG